MDATEGMKKGIAERKTNQVNSLKRLDTAVKESRTNRRTRMAEQRRTE